MASSIDVLSALFGGGGQKIYSQGGTSTTTSKKNLSSETVDALLKQILQGDGGVATVASGQRAAGLYDSPTTTLLLNNLLSQAATKVAAETATTTQTQTTPDTTRTVENTGLVSGNLVGNLAQMYALNKALGAMGIINDPNAKAGSSAGGSILDSAKTAYDAISYALNPSKSIVSAPAIPTSPDVIVGAPISTPTVTETGLAPISSTGSAVDTGISGSESIDVSNSVTGADGYSTGTGTGNYLAYADALLTASSGKPEDVNSGIGEAAGSAVGGYFGGPWGSAAGAYLGKVAGNNIITPVADIVSDVGTGKLVDNTISSVSNLVSDPVGTLVGKGSAVDSTIKGIGKTVSDVFKPITGGGGGSVICTELHRQGIMPSAFYYSTHFGNLELCSEVLEGYRLWAVPYVRLMRKSALATHFITPFVFAYLSAKLGQKTFLGKLLVAVGEPFCKYISRFAKNKDAYKSLYA